MSITRKSPVVAQAQSFTKDEARRIASNREAAGAAAQAVIHESQYFSGGRNAPGSQSKLVTTVWASKDTNFGVATSHRYDGH